MQVHYLNHERFQDGDTKLATRYAAKLMKDNTALKTITFLVYSKNQYNPFLREMQFSPKDFKTHGYPLKDGKLQIHTVKTYNPDYLFEGREPSEVLIAVGVPPQDLIGFEEKSDIAHCIIVPWTLDENREFLSVYEAIDIETGEVYPRPATADKRIANAIGWLKWTSYPNEGYHHPNDAERLHQMANALKRYNVPVEYSSTVYCGLHNGLLPSAARKTADAFVRAQLRMYAVPKDTNYAHLKQMMEEEHENL